MRIGIIGATGMLGHHTALAALAAGHEVVVIHRAGSDLSRIADLQFDAAVGDLNDEPSLTATFAELDCVINAAAYYPTVPRPWRDDVRDAMQQSTRFLNACRSSGVSRAVYVGGSIALRRADAPADVVGDESRIQAQPADTNPYVQCKWAMDDLFASASDDKLSVSIAIPAMTFGEFDYGPTTGQLITRLANGELPSYVRGNRNVIYAGDAGRGILAVAEKGGPGQRYLLTGVNTSMDELMTMVSDLTGQPAPRAAPLALAKLLSGLQTIRYRLGGSEPGISATAIAVMSSGQHLSGEKARKELGFESRTGLRDALQQALNWFREVGYVDG